MPNPTPNDVFVSRPLTNISTGFFQDRSKYVAGQIFPEVPVNLQGGLFWKYAMEDWYREEAKPRAPHTESAGGGWELEQDSFMARVYAFHKDISPEDRANAEAFDLERDATDYVTDIYLMTRERLFVNKYLTTGVWGTDLTGVSGAPADGTEFRQWNEAGSTPIADVQKQAEQMEMTTGRRPNVLVLTPPVKRVLNNHADILDRVRITQDKIVSEALLATLFEVDRVVTVRAIVNTANEGADASFDWVAGRGALLVYAPPRPGLKILSGGYIFTWRGLLGMNAYGGRILRFDIPEKNTTRVEIEGAFDMKVVAPEVGTFFATAVASDA